MMLLLVFRSYEIASAENAAIWFPKQTDTTHTQTPSMWPARSQPKPQETGNWRCLISFKMFYFGFGCRFAKVRLFALVVSLHVSIKRYFYSCKGFCLNTTSHFIVPSHRSALVVVCLLIRSICSSKFAYGKLEIVFPKLQQRKLKNTEREERFEHVKQICSNIWFDDQTMILQNNDFGFNSTTNQNELDCYRLVNSVYSIF